VSELEWRTDAFAELSSAGLYAILRERSRVFVVEQDCVYCDLDGLDAGSHHLQGLSPAGELAAYARLLPPGLSYPEASVGRVITSPEFRGAGHGRELLRRAIAECERLFGPGPLQIGAQRYLEGWYGEFGFKTVGEPYLEDGIPHLHMLRA